MTRDDIIRMAREAGLADSPEDYNPYWTADSIEDLERFAALVAAAEREACAKVCDNLAKDRGMFHPDDEDLKKGVLAGAGMCAVTIRARGKK
jgi:hypothetical protein